MFDNIKQITMAVNANKVLSGGKADGCFTKRLTTARTSVATIASPSDAVDLREIFVAGTNGGFVDELAYQFVGTGTQAATIVYFWITDTSGANAELDPTLSQTVLLASAAMSNTVQGQRGIINPSFQNLAAGRKIFASVSVLSASCELVVSAKGGQFESQ
jgi:hypothetical protein